MSISVKLYKGIGSRQQIKTVTYPSSAYTAALKDGFAVHADSKSAVRNYDSKNTSSSKTTSSSTPTKTSSSSSSAPKTSSSSSGSSAPKTTSSSVPATVLAAQDLNSYYAAIGRSLPSFSSRFSDPAFAAAAARAGISQSAYTGSASQNNAILNQLKTNQAQQRPPTSAVSKQNSGPSQVMRDLSISMANGGGQTQNNVRTQTGASSPVSDTSMGGGSPGTVYPMGNYSLVRFQGQGPTGYMNDQTIWLVDPSTQTLRPFSNAAALSNFFDGEVDIDQIVVMSAADLMPGGSLGGQNGAPGYQILSNEYAIQPDGSARRLEYSNAQLATRYGQPVDLDLEQEMFSALKGVLGMLETAGIDKATINKIKKDDAQMAFYVSAMAYGGYSIGDVYSDVKKRELGISNLSPISATADKNSYAATSDYQKAASDTRIMPPVEFAGMNSAELDLPVYQLPDEAFKTLVPILDYDSQEFKDAMAAVETSYYDLLEQQLRASTEQEKAVADYNYQEWKRDVERNFGIALSDNALEAWNQIQGVYNQGAQSGIFNSGIQNESIDSYLRRVRQQDQRMRDEKLTNEERQQMSYYLTAASPEQIKQLVETDPDKAKAWGLVPSDEIRNALSLSALKEKYPNEDEKLLAKYLSILLDENGNYRSQIYQKQLGSLSDTDLNSASMNNLTGLQTAKEEFRRSEALRKALLEEENAYREFTTPDMAFLRNSNPGAFEEVTGNKISSGKTDNLSSIIKQAGAGLKTGDSSPVVQTGGAQQANTPPAQTQRDTLMRQLKEAEIALNKLKSKTISPQQPNNALAAPQAPVKSGPSEVLRNLSIANAPKQGPVQYKPAQITSKFGGSTISAPRNTTSTTSGTTGSTLKNTLSKLKFW
jgi:hypothetical protein